MGVGGQCEALAALPPGKTWYPLYRRMGEPQGRSGRVQKISPSSEFDPRTVQHVASRYTDSAIAAPFKHMTVHKVQEADDSKSDTPSTESERIIQFLSW